MMWAVYGYFPFLPVLVSLHATREEAIEERDRLRDAGPHMGESYIIEEVSREKSYVKARVKFTKSAYTQS